MNITSSDDLGHENLCMSKDSFKYPCGWLKYQIRRKYMKKAIPLMSIYP